MVIQYIHIGTIGNLTLKGRWEYKSNSTIQDFNSEIVQVSGIFYTKDDVGAINKATILTVKDANNILIITGAVKQISKGQLNTRVWL